MPGRKDRPQVKDDELYERLRDRGDSKEKAARIANQAASEGRSHMGSRGGHAEDYEDRTKEELLQRAREIGIENRSNMTKRELISALRGH